MPWTTSSICSRCASCWRPPDRTWAGWAGWKPKWPIGRTTCARTALATVGGRSRASPAWPPAAWPMVRELWRWREPRPSAANCPPRRVLRDDLIVELAKRRTAEREADPRRAGDGAGRPGRAECRKIAAAIAAALALPEGECPSRWIREVPPQISVLGQFIFVRPGQHLPLGQLAPSLVGTPSDMRELVACIATTASRDDVASRCWPAAGGRKSSAGCSKICWPAKSPSASAIRSPTTRWCLNKGDIPRLFGTAIVAVPDRWFEMGGWRADLPGDGVANEARVARFRVVQHQAAAARVGGSAARWCEVSFSRGARRVLPHRPSPGGRDKPFRRSAASVCSRL